MEKLDPSSFQKRIQPKTRIRDSARDAVRVWKLRYMGPEVVKLVFPVWEDSLHIWEGLEGDMCYVFSPNKEQNGKL